MAYADINFKSKKDLKEAVARWAAGQGPPVTAHQPGGQFPLRLGAGIAIEGPHYPQPHKWYASATIELINGENVITKVR